MSEPENGASIASAEAKYARGIPLEKRERFSEVAAGLESFGAAHLDPELKGFVLELWRRICRSKRLDCRRGNPNVSTASVIHVIARMNFLFDKSQPVRLTFDAVCDFFGVKKTTVGGKASELERTLRLRQHSEPGLCRSAFIDDFTFVELSNGMVMTLGMAKSATWVRPDAKPQSMPTRYVNSHS